MLLCRTSAVIYRVSSNENIIIINNYKYRESVGNFDSQLIFDSNIYPKTNHNVVAYKNFNLLKNNNRWNFETTNQWITVHSFNISNMFNDKLEIEEAYYAHNINFYAEKNTHIIVLVNGSPVHVSNLSNSDSVFMQLFEKKLFTVKLVILNPSSTIVSIKDHVGNGYKQNAKCWLWFKYKQNNAKSIIYEQHNANQIVIKFNNSHIFNTISSI